jgi:hypothetical protein
MPNLAYKYLPPERLSYLEDELLRFTQPGDLNDPFECIPIIPVYDHDNLIERAKANLPPPGLQHNGESWTVEQLNVVAADMIKALSENPIPLSRAFFQQLLDLANGTRGILSLSERCDSPPMWAHYTNRHKGYCIGFNRDHPFFNQEGKELKSVDYLPERVRCPMPSNPENIDFFGIKSDHWTYEKELRMTFLFETADGKIPKPPNEQFDVYLFRVPHEAIVEIIWGISADEHLKSAIRKFGKTHGIPHYGAKADDHTFKIIKTEPEEEIFRWFNLYCPPLR